MNESFATVLETVADLRRDRLAVSHGERSRTWAELDERAARLAGALAANGIGHGSRVAVALYNGIEYLEAVYATLKLRAVPLNVNYRYRRDEIVQLLEDAQAEADQVISDARARADRVRAESERELVAASQRRDSINAQLTNVRQMLATLSGGAPVIGLEEPPATATVLDAGQGAAAREAAGSDAPVRSEGAGMTVVQLPAGDDAEVLELHDPARAAKRL